MRPAQITTVRELRDHVFPGAIAWRYGADGSVTGLSWQCPCAQGCGVESFRALTPDQWDGNTQAPTLNFPLPPITPCRWQGRLTAGVWQSETDNVE